MNKKYDLVKLHVFKDYLIASVYKEKSKEKKVIPGRKEEGKQKKKFTMTETSVCNKFYIFSFKIMNIISLICLELIRLELIDPSIE